MPYYNVLDVVRIKSEVSLRELESFETKAVGKEDIVIRCGSGPRFHPRFERKVLGGNSSLSYVEHLGSLGATVRLIPGRIVKIEVNWLLKYSNAVLYVNVVEPILRLILAEKGFSLLHGACLSRKDKAVLVSAPPDTGKTTTVLRCLDKHWFSFLSDDMTVIGRDLTVNKFPKPFTISAHTYNSMVADDLKLKGIKRKVKLKVKSLVHSRVGRRILRLVGELNLPILTLNAIGQIVVKPPKVFVEDLVRGVTTQSSAQPVAICLLRKGGEKIVAASPDVALEELLLNSEDAFGFPPYSDIFRSLKLNGRRSADILADEKALLRKLVASVKCFYLYSDSRKWDVMVSKVMDDLLKPTSVSPPIAPTAMSSLPPPILRPESVLRTS